MDGDDDAVRQPLRHSFDQLTAPGPHASPSQSPPHIPPRAVVNSIPSFRPSSGLAPPPLPPRPPPPLPPRPYTNRGPAQIRPAGRPNAGLLSSEKGGFSSVRPSFSSRVLYTRKRRLWCWGSVVAFIAALIIIVITVCASVIPKSRSNDHNDYNGGNPLSVADGGVDIGKPGDIAQFGNRSTDHFVMTVNRSIAVTRLDPIVDPNAIGSHLHRIHGSSYFTPNLTSATQIQELAKCTTAYVQDDKSAYWIPQLYYRFPNGSLVAIEHYSTSLYYFFKAPTGVPIYPFPDNFNIVAGNPYRRVLNASDPTQQAVFYRCYRGGDGSDDLHTSAFPTVPCAGGLVQTIYFPSCWDGVYAQDGNYTGHVAYPSDSFDGYICPTSFSRKMPAIQFETIFATYNYPFNGANNITWVLSNGDTSGLGIHGDFMNGWKGDTLQAIVDGCRYMNATSEYPLATQPENCPVALKTIDAETSYNCQLQTQIVNETVGEVIPIPYLPGCNGIWTGNTPKPACPPGSVDGGDLVLVDPTVWFQDEPYVS